LEIGERLFDGNGGRITRRWGRISHHSENRGQHFTLSLFYELSDFLARIIVFIGGLAPLRPRRAIKRGGEVFSLGL
jgi:hypothetical protein